ncbi:meiosis regulator and mRNA stability factor 1 isoform X2 [Palaemon carinicauda]|uniref:meiosis regulator and mRNA stability factor 1 isoform X2 n=1 Tax=Palaemon carinicauda TaxID=392227 RepID=UPI0035B66A4A
MPFASTQQVLGGESSNFTKMTKVSEAPSPSSSGNKLLRPTDFSVPQDCRRNNADFGNFFLPITKSANFNEAKLFVPNFNDSIIMPKTSNAPPVSKEEAEKNSIDLYPTIELLDGKEVVTLTKSSNSAPQNTLTVSHQEYSKYTSGSRENGLHQSSSHHNVDIKEKNKLVDPKTLSRVLENTDESTDGEEQSSYAGSQTCLFRPEDFFPNGVNSSEKKTNKVSNLTTPKGCFREDFTVKSNRACNIADNLQRCNNFSQYNFKADGDGNVNYKSDADVNSDLDDEYEQELLDLELQDEDDDDKETKNPENKATGYDSSKLPPIGVFWDIENCQVPRGLSATHVVQAIRSRFFNGQREAEFMCVCDTLKEHINILEELNDAQVNIVHVGSTVKNAADDKLLQSMRRFADIHGHGATIVLISGDSNFATELYDLRYRKNLRVVLVHNAHAQDSLKLCAHETALFSEVTQELPQRSAKSKPTNLRRSIIVYNLPETVEDTAVRRRLSMLSANCGGKVGRVRNDRAIITFQTPELASRAKKRLDGEDVYGNEIYCTFGKNLDKEGIPKVDIGGKFLPYQPWREKGQDLFDTWKPGGSKGYTNPSNLSMEEVGAANLSWRLREPMSEGGVQNPYSSFKSYSRHPSMSYASDNGHFNTGNQRNWRKNCRPQNQSIGGLGMGSFNGLSRLDYSNRSDDNNPDIAVQPMYLDKTPEQFRKGRSQRVHFRMSSPPSLTFNTRTPDTFTMDSSFRARSPSPLLWNNVSPVKNTWSPSLALDIQGQVLYGLRDMAVSEGSVLDNSHSSVPQIPVELQITNLDQNIDAREMKRILFTIFRDHVMVLHVSVFIQSDGNLAATLRVPSQQDAQYAISQLHRKKIGAKRIIISHVNHNQPSPELKRSKVIALLQEVPGKKLPLFKFRELYEKRFHETIGVSELYNMRDIVTVSDNSTGRMVSLHPEFRHVSSPVLIEEDKDEVSGTMASRFCRTHSSEPDDSVGWAERDQSISLPNVNMSLRSLAASIHSLLQSHSGTIPLASMVECYQAEIGPLEEDENGVPIEHLVSCLPGVCIIMASSGFKFVQWLENKVTDEAEELARCVSPPLVGQLALFSRELVDLLKTFPFCRLAFSRFIPAYHHHFGRQCRVADYGFTKLADLFDSLPHVVQVLGDGNKRVLTLAHKAQIKRFSSDLLRVLKGQPTKSITLEAFPSAYEKAVSKPWNVVDYGVCDFEDLLSEVSETTVLVIRSGTETTIAMPKREQTPEEIERTRQFAAEVIELLRHSPQCKMQFNRFIPAYHHHFGRQCRVADYGFSKLIELFEAIPDTLLVFDDEEDGEKLLQLVERERIKVLGDQIAAVVKGAPRQVIKISALTQVFTKYYGYSLRPSHYESTTLEELIGKLRNHVKFVETGEEPLVTLVDRSYVQEILVQARKLLWDEPGCSLDLPKFIETYTETFGNAPNLDVVRRDLQDIMVIEGEEDEAKIRLVPVQVFARDMLTLLHEAGGRMLLLNFDTAYLDRFGVACRPATYGFPNIVALVQSLGDLVAVRGRGTKRILVLNRENSSSPPLPSVPASSSIVYLSNAESSCVGDSQVSQQSQMKLPHKVSQSPPQCDYQQYFQETNSNNHLIMGMNPSAYQPSSPIVYPGSPAPTGGSVMWGQMWSPQYPVMPPLSPAHYMVPTIPLSWGNVPAPPVAPLGTAAASTTTAQPALTGTLAPPISIHTLDELSKQDVKGGEYATPPSASELPSPELFTHISTEDIANSVPLRDNRLQGVTNPLCGDDDDTWSSCTSDPGKASSSSTPSAPKLRTKRRLAAQFASN